MKRLLSFCIAAALCLSFSVTALAADSDIIWYGRDRGFGVNGGSEYTETDLFDNFKSVMPGDKIYDTVTITNEDSKSDYVKLFMRAEEHNEESNPVTAETDETIGTMEDFLSQLTMRVYCGEDLIFESSPDKTASLTENTFLAKLSKGESSKISVELDVPLSLDNAYANRLGEVDWVFFVEEYEGDSLIQTGQLNWPIPVLATVGAMMLLAGIVMLLKKRKDSCE